MRHPKSTIALALAGMIAAGTAFAQAPPPPAPGAAPAAGAVAPPPPGTAPDAAALAPPPPPAPGAAPPPPPGPHVVLDRGANGFVHVDVHCTEPETTKGCADIASRLLAETGPK